MSLLLSLASSEGVLEWKHNSTSTSTFTLCISDTHKLRLFCDQLQVFFDMWPFLKHGVAPEKKMFMFGNMSWSLERKMNELWNLCEIMLKYFLVEIFKS